MISITLSMEDNMHSNISHLNYPQQPLPQTGNSLTIAAQGATVIRRWLQAAARNWKRRKMIASLEAMDDWLLRDIGIERGDIISVVNGFDERELMMAPMSAR
jgi:uncharacterized protein YjiS (DUF1127 family)